MTQEFLKKIATWNSLLYIPKRPTGNIVWHADNVKFVSSSTSLSDNSACPNAPISNSGAQDFFWMRVLCAFWWTDKRKSPTSIPQATFQRPLRQSLRLYSTTEKFLFFLFILTVVKILHTAGRIGNQHLWNLSSTTGLNFFSPRKP